MRNIKNYAFIDGQNLHLGTSTEGWIIDPFKLKVYLSDKYKISKAYYFLGYVKDENNGLYTRLQEAGFIVVFKKQMVEMTSNKKGNIDSDMIFTVMEKLLEEGEQFNKIVLVSGDGDFKILVDYLIKKERFEKILFPNKKFTSSMYKGINLIYKDYLINSKTKIEYIKKK
ncbi:MAG: NYN domain-containing protein [Candidatus Altimarinota bacterium]